MDIIRITSDDPLYPSALKLYIGSDTFMSIATLGNVDILCRKTLAFYCSVKCLGDMFLETYDLVP